MSPGGEYCLIVNQQEFRRSLKMIGKQNLLRDNEQYVNSLLYASKESMVIIVLVFFFRFITGVQMVLKE